jgi:hypothetical protein
VRAEDCTRFSFLQGFGSWVQISGFLLVKLLRGKSILFGVCSSFFFSPFFGGGSRSFSSSSSEQYIRYRIVGAAGFSVFLRELLCCVRVCVCVCVLSRESCLWDRERESFKHPRCSRYLIVWFMFSSSPS